MTTFNSVFKIGKRFASELDGLISKLLEESGVFFDIYTKTKIFSSKGINTISKIRRRKVGELQGIKIRMLEDSLVSVNFSTKIKLLVSDKYNTISKIRRRKIGEINLLKSHLLQYSLKEEKVSMFKIKAIRPIKTHKNKIMMLIKYVIKTRH